MLITPERKVPQRSDTSQNDHKSKGYPSKTSEAAFTMQKSVWGGTCRYLVALGQYGAELVDT